MMKDPHQRPRITGKDRGWPWLDRHWRPVRFISAIIRLLETYHQPRPLPWRLLWD